jgi:hypothetical protein
VAIAQACLERIAERHAQVPIALRTQTAGSVIRPEMVERLRALGEQYDGSDIRKRKLKADAGPITGTQLIREWKGVEHRVTVHDEDFEYQGRPYKSLSAVARSITGTRWNGLIFFGLKNQRT